MRYVILLAALLLLFAIGSAAAMSQAEKNEAMNNSVAAAIASVRTIYEKPTITILKVRPVIPGPSNIERAMPGPHLIVGPPPDDPWPNGETHFDE